MSKRSKNLICNLIPVKWWRSLIVIVQIWRCTWLTFLFAEDLSDVGFVGSILTWLTSLIATYNLIEPPISANKPPPAHYRNQWSSGRKAILRCFTCVYHVDMDCSGLLSICSAAGNRLMISVFCLIFVLYIHPSNWLCTFYITVDFSIL